MGSSNKDFFKWWNVEEQNNSVVNHAMVHRNIYMVANDEDKVLIYDTYSPVGNHNESIAERLVPVYKKQDATKVIFVPLLILPDSPSRYY